MKTTLSAENPDLARQWHPTKNGELKPDMVSPNSNKKVWWVCEKNHEWQVRIAHRNKGSNCPICRGLQVLTGFNDLKTVNPKLAAEWYFEKNGNLTPDKIMPNSRKKVWWKCSKGHEWQAVVISRNRGLGCPICSGKQVLAGFNDLATKNPKLAEEWDFENNGDLKPNMVMPNSGRKVWWICAEGHKWQATVASRNNRGKGCPKCAIKNRVQECADLATTHPKLVAEWHPTKNDDLTPFEIISGNKKVWWICEKNHEWQARIDDRKRGSGCPICSGRQVLSGYNDLTTKNPVLAEEWDFENIVN